MAITVTYGITLSGGGTSFQSPAITRTGSGSIGLSEDLVASQSGVLTTRSDANTGTITMGSGGHTIGTGDVVDIYWTGGVQYGVTVGTVSGTSVPFDSGIGDDLPTATTAVKVVPVATANVLIDGDNVKVLGVELSSTTKSERTAGHLQFLDAADNEIAEIDVVSNMPQVWDIEGGSANPFTGAPITQVVMSQGGNTSGQSYTLKIIGVADATP